MRITYDHEARAAYIYVDDSEGLILLTRPFGDSGRVNLDLDADAEIVGIELLDVSLPVVEDITRRPDPSQESDR